MQESEATSQEGGQIGPFTTGQIEEIYFRMMAANFYDESYNADVWIKEPYRLLANIINSISDPGELSRVVDLGCGQGFLVEALNDMGIEAHGYDFSASILEQTSGRYPDRYRSISSIDEIALEHVSLLVATEVFEHLPISILIDNMRWMREGLKGLALLTMPSSGRDPRYPRLGFIEADPSRLSDMAQVRMFQNLPTDQNGWPAVGHISLASWRWWDDLFLSQGLQRVASREVRFRNYINELDAYRWCPYILRVAELDRVELGNGWSFDADGPICAPVADFNFVTDRSQFQILLDAEVPSPNIALDTRLIYEVSRILIADDFIMQRETLAVGSVELEHGRAQVRLPIAATGMATSPAAVRVGAIQPFTAYRVRLCTPSLPDAPAGLDAQSAFKFHGISVS